MSSTELKQGPHHKALRVPLAERDFHGTGQGHTHPHGYDNQCDDCRDRYEFCGGSPEMRASADDEIGFVIVRYSGPTEGGTGFERTTGSWYDIEDAQRFAETIDTSRGPVVVPVELAAQTVRSLNAFVEAHPCVQ